jgi:hypothetical protein
MLLHGLFLTLLHTILTTFNQESWTKYKHSKERLFVKMGVHGAILIGVLSPGLQVFLLVACFNSFVCCLLAMENSPY